MTNRVSKGLLPSATRAQGSSIDTVVLTEEGQQLTDFGTFGVYTESGRINPDTSHSRAPVDRAYEGYSSMRRGRVNTVEVSASGYGPSSVNNQKTLVAKYLNKTA